MRKIIFLVFIFIYPLVFSESEGEIRSIPKTNLSFGEVRTTQEVPSPEVPSRKERIVDALDEIIGDYPQEEDSSKVSPTKVDLDKIIREYSQGKEDPVKEEESSLVSEILDKKEAEAKPKPKPKPKPKAPKQAPVRKQDFDIKPQQEAGQDQDEDEDEDGKEEEKAPVVIDSDEISYLQGEGKLIAHGNVVIKQKGVELFCDEAHYDANSGIAQIKGNIKIVKDNSVIFGDDGVYNFNANKAEMVGIRLQDPPVYGKSKEGYKLGNEKFILKKGYISTCDLDTPHYRIITKKATIYPGDRIVARNVVFKVGKVPVLYLPYFSQSLKDKIPIEELSPGKNKEWGVFALSRWRYRPNDKNKGRFYFDLYGKRGLGLGLANKSDSSKFGKSLLTYYAFEDKLYKRDKRKELFEIYPERKNIADKFLEDDRYRAQFSYSWDPTPDLAIEAEFHKFSDEYFMKDFFEEEYKVEANPLTYALFNYSLPGASLSLLTQKRANRFWSQGEYLPQLELDFFKTNIGESNFYFESTDKIGNLNNTFINSGIKDSTVRLHSQNTLSYANKIKWLSYNPYVTSFQTFYSRNQVNETDLYRETRETGITLSTNLYKFIGGGFKMLGEQVDKARHVITPEMVYIHRHDPSIANDQLYSFDEVDSITREENFSFTLKNKLQFKNEERTWDFIYFSPSVNYIIDPEGGRSRFQTITTDLGIYPREGLALNANSSYDIFTGRITSFNIDITTRGIRKIIKDGEEVEKEDYSFSYGHRYVRQNSSQSTTNFTYQLTPKLKFRNYMRYEFSGESLERQQYAIRADLHCWWMDLGIDVDKNTKGSKDLTFWLMFTMKAFDDISIDFDQTYHGAKSDYFRDKGRSF
jgi:LPS-assembly protein